MTKLYTAEVEQHVQALGVKAVQNIRAVVQASSTIDAEARILSRMSNDFFTTKAIVRNVRLHDSDVYTFSVAE